MWYCLSITSFLSLSRTTGNFAGSGRSEDVAALFTGYLKSNSNGLAWFCLKSSDGSRLYVDNIMKVNNDGIHEPRSRCGAVKMLQDTIYKITVDFFLSKGESSLVLKWRQPGALKFAKIPPSLWVGTVSHTIVLLGFIPFKVLRQSSYSSFHCTNFIASNIYFVCLSIKATYAITYSIIY